MPCLKHPGALSLPQQQFPWAAGACLQTVRHREDRTIVFVDENGLSTRPTPVAYGLPPPGMDKTNPIHQPQKTAQANFASGSGK